MSVVKNANNKIHYLTGNEKAGNKSLYSFCLSNKN